jgi:tetratricopeptide (TPR) repeat protein
MANTQRGDISKQVKHIYRLYDLGKLDEAKRLTIQVKNEYGAMEDEHQKIICQKYVAACLVDVGSATNDEDMVKEGTQYFQDWVNEHATEDELVEGYYNLGNGYYCLWWPHRTEYMGDGNDAEEHRLARHYYRLATEHIQSHHPPDSFASQVWTNYGNALSHVNRSIEAIDAYDMALNINPLMGMALGNKAIALSYLAPHMHGHTHLFYLESIRLLEIALAQPLTPGGRSSFNARLEYLKHILSKHGEMKPEEAEGIEPETPFHRFLCEFCARHGLFLNPATFLGEKGKAFYGDPIFISTMYAELEDRDKFDRYVTFLNEIKQDYVMGRYFLVESQYQSPDIDAVDKGVSVFYPLDYSLYSTYIQLLKAANKQAIDVLDKIACFIHDYCKLRTPKPDRVSFRNIWGNSHTVTDDLIPFASPHLFALYNLAQDVSERKDWQGDWVHLYRYRNALTHRFLIIHEMQLDDQTNKDIPRVKEGEFLRDTILAFKIARAALVYLILFVEHIERVGGTKVEGPTLPVVGTPVEGVLRHRPQ